MATSRQRTTLTNLLMLILLLAVIPGWMGIKSTRMGKDTNFDLRLYHFYSGYEILNNRIDIDIAPGEEFFNPILDVPLYWSYTHLPSKVVGFLYGFVHGLNLSLIMLLFINVAAFKSNMLKILGGLSVAVIAATSPGFLSELGGSMNDNIVSLFTLASIWAVLKSAQLVNQNNARSGFWLLAFAGFLMGLIIGGKLTAVVFAVSVGLLLPILFTSPKAKLNSLWVFILGGLAGFLVIDGFWLLMMWQRYKNPFFPLYNNLFNSPFAFPKQYLDKRFLPENISEYLLWPFIFSRNSLRVSELKFSDVRFGITYAGIILWAVTSVVKWVYRKLARREVGTNQLILRQREGNYLVCFMGLAFILWMVQFSIYRYMTVLELLTPLIFLVVLDRVFSNKLVLPFLGLAAVFLGSQYYTPYNWGRSEWTDRYIQLDQTQIQDVHNANVIMLGWAPTSYVIPFFQPDVRFLRPEGSILNYNSVLSDEIYQIIHTSGNPVYLLYDPADAKLDLERSAVKLGLDFDQMDCQVLRDNMPDDLYFCKVLVK